MCRNRTRRAERPVQARKGYRAGAGGGARGAGSRPVACSVPVKQAGTGLAAVTFSDIAELRPEIALLEGENRVTRWGPLAIGHLPKVIYCIFRMRV